MLTDINFEDNQDSPVHNSVGNSVGGDSISGPFSSPSIATNHHPHHPPHHHHHSTTDSIRSNSSGHTDMRTTTITATTATTNTTPTTATNINASGGILSASPTINITSNLASSATTGGRPATLPISSPFGPPSDTNLTTMVKSTTTTGDLNSTGLLATLATPKNTPLDSMKEWTDTFYKCTLQYVNEKLGKCSRTVDASLEAEIERLRDTQRKYLNILETCRHMIKVYNTLVRQQLYICKSFGELAIRESKRAEVISKGSSSSSFAFDLSPTTNGGGGGSSDGTPVSSNSHGGENGSTTTNTNTSSPMMMMSLTVDFRSNADMFRSIAKSGEKLILALRFFCSNLDTVANKTIEDTIVTIKAYESSRLEFDAEKNAVANLLPAQAASAANTEKLISSKAKFERLRDDVQVKMQFLEENKAKVMHKQLLLLHNAFAAYASGNAESLESTLKQFSIKAPTAQSWLEK